MVSYFSESTIFHTAESAQAILVTGTRPLFLWEGVIWERRDATLILDPHFSWRTKLSELTFVVLEVLRVCLPAVGAGFALSQSVQTLLAE